MHSTSMPKFKYKNADWTSYSNQFSAVPDNDIKDDDLQQYLTKFQNKILETANSTIPKSRPGLNKRPPQGWWNEECKQVITAKRKAGRRYNAQQTEDNRVLYRKADSVVKEVVAKAKYYHFHTFAHSQVTDF